MIAVLGFIDFLIARYWRGFSQPETADAYLRHLEEDTFLAIKMLEGFCGAEVLRFDNSDEVEFIVITKWDRLEHIKKFAGDYLEIAVVPPKAQQLLCRYDEHVRHYQVAIQSPS